MQLRLRLRLTIFSETVAWVSTRVFIFFYLQYAGCRGRDRMVVGFITTCMYASSAYRHQSCEFEPRSWRDVLDITLCDKVCQ